MSILIGFLAGCLLGLILGIKGGHRKNEGDRKRELIKKANKLVEDEKK